MFWLTGGRGAWYHGQKCFYVGGEPGELQMYFSSTFVIQEAKYKREKLEREKARDEAAKERARSVLSYVFNILYWW